MNREYENGNRSGQRNQYQSEDLSLKGYNVIGALSIIIGVLIVGLLNLMTPLEIVTERLAYLSRFSGLAYYLHFVPPFIFLLLVYVFFHNVLNFILRPVSGYLKIIASGNDPPKSLKEKAGRRLLNIPFIFIPVNLVMWIGILAVPAFGGYLAGLMDLRTVASLSARAGMVGLISSLVASHLMEAYSRRMLIPFFFPQGRLVNVGGAFRISISRRIQLLSLMGIAVPGIILLVTLMTLQWEVEAFQISPVEYGWIIIRFSLLLFGIFFILTQALNRVGSRNITEPFNEVIRVLKATRNGQFDENVQVVSNDEIGYAGDVINEMTNGLKERDLMKRSLELAMEVQQHLLPRKQPRIKGLDIAGKSIYCDETGGDYYDFIKLDGNGRKKTVIVVGDVSGHGIPSALLMATARAYIRQRASLPGEPSQIISDVNRQIAGDVEESGQFMTLLYMIVDQKNQRLEWIRAGHDPGIIYDPVTDNFEELAGPGLALGVNAEWNYETNRKEGLKEGQIIVLGTDGIWEAQNSEGEMFGKEALFKKIRENADAEANVLLETIIDSLDQFRNGFSLQDDVTLIVVKIGSPVDLQ